MTNSVSINPEQAQSTINAWYIFLAPAGAAAWHFILQISPWAKSNGGLIRGVVSFFWFKGWNQAPKS